MVYSNILLDVSGTFGDNNSLNTPEVLVNNICCIVGCGKPLHALGMCTQHYRNVRNYGSPLGRRRLADENRNLTNEERFWKSVEKSETGCWLWKAGRDDDGYGIFHARIHGLQVHSAHRFSHILHTGEILRPDIMVLHSCDNPPCCNPDHLRSGTAADNTGDMIKKGRHLRSQKARFMQIAK